MKSVLNIFVRGYPRGLITSRRKSVSKQAIALLIKTRFKRLISVLSVLILLQALTRHNKSKSLQYREVPSGGLCLQEEGPKTGGL